MEKNGDAEDKLSAKKASVVPHTMRAACYEKYGSPLMLSVASNAVPRIKTDEVLIKIYASTVNRTDCGFLRGQPFIVRFFSGLFSPNSKILGCEFAGEVIEVGQDVVEFDLGDRVFGFKDDDFGFGGHAEYTAMSVKGMLAKIPQHLSYQQAAPGLEGSHYALSSIRAAKIGPEHHVLVNGATGAIGSAAIQIMKHLGARVTAVCALEHFDIVREFGVDELIDYKNEDFTLLSTKFDVVFDAVGKSTFDRSRRVMKEGGIYMSTELGPWCQNPLFALWTKWIGKHRVMFPIPVNRFEDAAYICSLMAAGDFKPLVDRTYALDEIVEAFNYVETGMKTGNVVIRVQ